MIHRDKKGKEHKVCTMCDKLQPIDSFWLDRRRGKVKRRASCKSCESARYKQYKREDYEPTRLPAAPLIRIVEQRALEQDLSWDELAASLGTSARTFYDWRHGKRKVVNLDTADKIVTGLGFIWEDVFDDKTCERLRAVA